MKIEIGKPKKANKQPKSKFKFKIELMGGDADGYFYPEVLVGKDNPYLGRFLEFLDNCAKEYPYGKGGDDNYYGVKDYWLFVDDDCMEEYLDEEGEWQEITNEVWEDKLLPIKKECGISFEWESSYEYFGTSSYRGVTVTYFDDNGIEHTCSIKK